MKTLRASFFSLMLVNLIKAKILHFLITVLAWNRGALRRKQLASYFLDQLKQYHENTICTYSQFS